ncbi:hypothetical protein ACRQGA_08105 [Actinotignum sp. GS-2025b]|uniref:hypothetical protein n=1 Tax=Actinotignum sp. GS-2025b TaxID=3427275 RepID=UPI003F47F1BD
MSIVYGPTYTSLEQIQDRMKEILADLHISREEYEERMAEYTLNQREADYRPEYRTLKRFEELALSDEDKRGCGRFPRDF